MTSTIQLIDLLGAGALLIWGLRLIKTGVLSAFGASLRQWIRKGTGNRIVAAGSGFLATLAMQSSTATAVITASFAGRSIIEPKMGQAVMLGANVGTAVAALVLSLDVHWFGSAMVLIGVVTSLRSRFARGKGLGRSILGLGLMLLSLKLLGSVTDPLRQSDIVIGLLKALGDAPLLALLVASMLAFISSSSLAVVLFVSLLLGSGVVPTPLAVVLVAGANLGGAVPPWLAVSGEGTEARRLAAANLLVRLLGATVLTILATPVASTAGRLISEPSMLAVVVHFGFNVCLLLTFLPLLTPVNRIANLLVPASRGAGQQNSYLDETVLGSPSLALAGAAREALRVGDFVNQMLEVSLEGLRKTDPALKGELAYLEDKVDTSHEAIKFYLAKLDRDTMGEDDRRRSDEIVSYAINLEHIGDIVHRGLCEQALKKSSRHLSFSAEGMAEISTLYARTLNNVQLAQSVFLTRDPDLARRLAEAKVEVRLLEAASSMQHLQRVREKRSETLETSAMHLDILRDLKRINAHLASVAVSVLEERGGTSASRLLPDHTPLAG